MSHARIGRIRMKAGGADVLPMRKGGAALIQNDRKANFVNHVGASFDSYTTKYGYEPDCVVLVLGGLKQTAESYWTISGDSEGGGTTMLALAQATLTREIGS